MNAGHRILMEGDHLRYQTVDIEMDVKGTDHKDLN
jgi:hypothetical protein